MRPTSISTLKRVRKMTSFSWLHCYLIDFGVGIEDNSFYQVIWFILYAERSTAHVICTGDSFRYMQTRTQCWKAWTVCFVNIYFLCCVTWGCHPRPAIYHVLQSEEAHAQTKELWTVSDGSVHSGCHWVCNLGSIYAALHSWKFWTAFFSCMKTWPLETRSEQNLSIT